MLAHNRDPLRRLSRLLTSLLVVLFATSSCAADPAPTTPVAIVTPTHGAAAPSYAPLPTSVPPPTPIDPAIVANTLLRANPDPHCSDDRNEYCDMPWSVRMLEHLRQYPNSPRRAELLERIVDLMDHGDRLSFDWLVTRWFDEAVRQPIAAAAGRLPRGFAERWKQRGEIREVDLDADQIPDYFVTFHYGRLNGSDRAGGLRWIHRVAGTYQIETLPTRVDHSYQPLQPVILAVQDVNGDGRTDVVYRLTTCGAATCFEHLHVFSWRDGAWWDLKPSTWSTTNGDWSIQNRGDGTVELVGEQNHPGYDFGPLVAYRVHFAPIHGEFAPVRVSTDLSLAQWDEPNQEGPPDDHLDKAALFLQWSQRLTYAHRLTETLELLQPVANSEQAPDQADDIDYRPHALLRLGMAHLLLRDVAAARQSWRSLQRRFPNTPIERAVQQLLPLLQRPQDVWRVCIELRRLAPSWQTVTGGGGYAAAFAWSDQCDPRVLLPLTTWNRRETIKVQMARLGLGWNLISADYDLNGDGTPDLIGVLDYGGERSPWAFLSAGPQYHPLFAAQTFPLGSTGLDTDYDYRRFEKYQDVRVTDLDNNGVPELLLAQPHAFVLMEWNGDRFRNHHAVFDPGPPGAQFSERERIGTLLLEQQLDGTRMLRATLTDAHGQAAGVWLYALRDGMLTRVAPPVADRSMLSVAVEALFRADDPQQALRALDGFVPDEGAQPQYHDFYPIWQRAAADYLRGLALEYSGDHRAARVIWSVLAQRYPDSGWGLMAVEQLR